MIYSCYKLDLALVKINSVRSVCIDKSICRIRTNFIRFDFLIPFLFSMPLYQ
jgi:hypothetical protein